MSDRDTILRRENTRAQAAGKITPRRSTARISRRASGNGPNPLHIETQMPVLRETRHTCWSRRRVRAHDRVRMDSPPMGETRIRPMNDNELREWKHFCSTTNHFPFTGVRK